MLSKIHSNQSLRFTGWSRKSYAAFQSIGRHVTIGNLKNIVADTFLGKQKNTLALAGSVAVETYEVEEETADPPDEALLTLVTILQLPQTVVLSAKEYRNGFYINRCMADSRIAISHFYFKLKSN